VAAAKSKKTSSKKAPKASKSSVSKSKSTKDPATMEELLTQTGHKIRAFTRGEKVEARLLEIGKKRATFDIGGKSEGVVSDANFIEAKPFLNEMKKGDSVLAMVLDPESRDGTTQLSLRHAAQNKFWEKLIASKDEDREVTVIGKTVTSHGMMVELDNHTAFIPASQFGSLANKDLEAMIETRFKVKIIDIDRERGRIVLSERSVSEADDIARAEHALDVVKIGETYEGVITTVVTFGVFVEIEVEVGETEPYPIEGLVHVSELSWGKVDTPADLYAEGDEAKVKVLGVEHGKLALSIKQAMEDPWVGIEGKYPVDAKITGTIVRISDFGAFVELEPGVEGLIHMTKIPPGTSLKNGESVNCYIEEVNEGERKISLGIVLTASKPVGYR